jgi:hypothetical protein
MKFTLEEQKKVRQFIKKKYFTNAVNGDPSPDQHGCHISGGFILFGGWLNIYDTSNNNKDCYCSFGGLGAGGWGDNGTLDPCNINDSETDWYSWDYIYANVRRCMIESTPVSGQIIILMDSNSTILCSVNNLSTNAPYIGGGSARWK